MKPDALCTEEDIDALVRDFYGLIRRDAALGPIFEAHVHDWDRHEATLVDFWSSILLRTGRFAGAPMPRHAVLPGLNAELFEHWLEIFRQTTADQPNREMGDRAYQLAERIAQSLWFGYQANRAMTPKALELGHG